MPARPVPPSHAVPGTEQGFGTHADAVQDTAGRLHLLAARGPRGRHDVRYLCSDDVGETWSEAVRLGECRAFRIGLREGCPFAVLVGPDLRVHDLDAPGAPVVSSTDAEAPFRDSPVGIGVGRDGRLHIATVQPAGGLVPDPHPWDPDPSGLALGGQILVTTQAPDPFGEWTQPVRVADVPGAIARFRADAADPPVVVVGETETAVLWVGSQSDDWVATSPDGTAWTVGRLWDADGAGIPGWKPRTPSAFGYTGRTLWSVASGSVARFGPVVRHGDAFRVHDDVVVSVNRSSRLQSAVTTGDRVRVAWVDERNEWTPWFARTALTSILGVLFVGLGYRGYNNDLFVATIEDGRKGPSVRLTPPRCRTYGTLLLVGGPRPLVVWSGIRDLGHPPCNLSQPYRLFVTPLPDEALR